MAQGRRHRWLRVPSPAMIVALIALFIALGGTSYAAIRLPANSVGTKQLQKNAVTGLKVKNGSLTGADVKLSTLGKVPSAVQADSATTAANANHAVQADSATTAANAEHAVDADTLGGIGPSAFGTAIRMIGWEFTAPYSDTVCAEDVYGALRWISGSRSFVHGVQLPQGAQITAFKLFVNNQGVAVPGHLYLIRSPLQRDNASWAQWELEAAGTSGNHTTTYPFAAPILVDNNQYAYGFRWVVESTSQQLLGAEVDYRLL
jgi:hypothetical protein